MADLPTPAGGAAGTRAPPRVVLVEDDPSIRRFVEMALEDLPIRLVCCARLADGIAALEAAPAALVLTDLRLPDGNGLELVERLAAGADESRPRVVVFSAGVEPALRARLEALGVTRVLAKPVPLRELLACVESVLADDESVPAQPVSPSAVSPAPDDAVLRHFGGDAELHAEFLAACVEQFPHDLRAGDEASAQGDLPALRRLAHSLSTVLLTLGRENGHAIAARLEADAAAGTLEATRSGWRALAGELRAITRA